MLLKKRKLQQQNHTFFTQTFWASKLTKNEKDAKTNTVLPKHFVVRLKKYILLYIFICILHMIGIIKHNKNDTITTFITH